MNTIQQNFLILLLLGTFTSTAWAQTANQAERLIQDYLEAHKTKNEERQIELWNQLKQNADLLRYIQDNHRQEYTLFKYRQMQDRIDALQTKYNRGGFVKRNLKRIRSTADRSSSTPSSNTTSSTNQDQPANKVRSSSSNSRIRRTNRNTTRSFSNQSRARSQSNQRRLRRR